jgi:hypothetical protein
MLVIFASYDGLGQDPNGTIFAGANHNAAGVGTMLEIARLWNEQELDPRRSVLFVAWGGGQLDQGAAKDFLDDRFKFRHLITNDPRDNVVPSLVVQLDYVGAGGDTLLYHPNSSKQLVEILEETASETGLVVKGEIDSSEFTPDIITQRIPWISIRWENAQISPIDDTFEKIDRDKLQSLGETLSLMLIKLVREVDF